MSRIRVSAVLAALCLFAAAFAVVGSGCAGTQEAGGFRAKVLCPKCHAETTLKPIGDIDYETCLCPACGHEYGEVWDGYKSLNADVHFCSNCKAVVELCPSCRGK